MRVRALAAALLLAACVPPADGPGGVETLRGRTSVVGSAPMNVRVSFQGDDGRRVTLVGPLAEELGRLAGADLEVEGRLAGAELEPSGYRVVAVDGRPAWVGTVEAGPGGALRLRLDDGSTLALGSAPAGLRAGQKVWVQGPGQVQVQTFGIIVP